LHDFPQAKLTGRNYLKDAPRTFKLQVRTLFMHAWAEPQQDPEYKAAEDLPGDMLRELSWIAASSWGADQAFGQIVEWQKERSGCKT
jgi:ppGpp synthetase/RelA/SpoT-type nucleotidyltranferase